MVNHPVQRDETDVSRRSFLSAAGAAGAAVSLSVRGLADPSPPVVATPETAAVVDQIVGLFGGWDFDQAAVEREIAAARSPEARASLSHAAKRYRARQHAIQCALQGEKAGVEEPFLVAGLLHDIGHLFSPPSPAGVEDRYDDKHEIYGALWLRDVFVPEVSEPVLHHVPAKRWLVTTRSDYHDRLSSGSKRSLEQQGGRMSDPELAAFELQAFWREGVEVRIWDDNAKAKDFELPPMERFVPAIERSMKKRG